MSSVATIWAPASSSSNRVRDRRQPRGEGKAGGAAFQVGHGALEGEARRVLAARIFEALVHAGALLGVGRGRVDRHHDRAGRRVVALAAMDGAGREGEAVAWRLVHRERLRWLIRSMRVIRPTNSSPSKTIATSLRSKTGSSASSDWLACSVCSLRGHGGADRRVEAIPAAVIGAVDLGQDVALVDDADQPAVVEHRQLRDVAAPHAAIGGEQGVVGADEHACRPRGASARRGRAGRRAGRARPGPARPARNRRTPWTGICCRCRRRR